MTWRLDTGPATPLLTPAGAVLSCFDAVLARDAAETPGSIARDVDEHALAAGTGAHPEPVAVATTERVREPDRAPRRPAPH
jgi:hypothetical protein